MATNVGLSILFIYLCSLLLPALSSITLDAAFAPTQKTNDQPRKKAIQLALQAATATQNNNKQLEQKCSSNEEEKAAWDDCIDLYKETIADLNRCLDTTLNSTNFAIQTWLSSASTSVETCKDRFNDIKASDCKSSILSNNVSKLISDCLNLNSNASSISPENDDGFPSWVKENDRKLLMNRAPSPAPDLVVAKDGSGKYRTIKEAIDAAAKTKRKINQRFVIHIKSGIYEENIDIRNNLNDIMLVGDGMEKTIITGNRSFSKKFHSYDTGTVRVFGQGFMARGITFRNTAGAAKRQAVAFMSIGDHTVLYQCAFDGYQDTLYAHSNKQFYKECSIYGTVDFICGNAAAIFQNCNIYAKKPLDNQYITITAQGRAQAREMSGFIIQNSRVMAALDLKPVQSKFKIYLGRPWKTHSRTVFMNSYLDSLVDPAGWIEWEGAPKTGLNTLYYGEYKNTGPGSSTAKRVKWPGYKVLSDAEASKFTVTNFINGNKWLPAVGVPFVAGL